MVIFVVWKVGCLIKPDWFIQKDYSSDWLHFPLQATGVWSLKLRPGDLEHSLVVLSFVHGSRALTAGKPHRQPVIESHLEANASLFHI